MPDVNSIPFRQASGNGHYESKQLPNDNADFLTILGLPTSVGNVTSASVSTLDGQLAAYWGVSGSVIKASTQIGIVNLVDGVVTTKTTPAGEIVGTTAVQTLTNKTLVTPVITGTVTGIDKSSVGLGNVDNTSDANKPVSGPQQTALNLKQDLSAKAQPSGYASLDSGGKVPAAQLPAVVQGGVNYQGPWNALSNTPVMPVATAANKGWYYVVTIAGSTMVDGVNEWAINDWIVSNGSTWNKIDNTDAVTSVAGRQGAVVLTKTDVGLDQVDNTSDATKNAAAVTLTNKTIVGNANTLVVRLNADVTGNLPPGNLDSGAGASSASFWRGDGHWGTPAGGGDVAGPGGSVDGELALYNGVSGTILKRTSGTGIANVLNGVWQTPIATAALTPRYPANFLNGLTIKNNATDLVNDVDVAVGQCRSDDNTYDIVLASPMTKRLDAVWAAGTAAGGRDTATALTTTSYHVFVIANTSTSAVDVLLSPSISAPVMPGGFTVKRRVGSVRWVTSALLLFVQAGDYFAFLPTAPADMPDGQPSSGSTFQNGTSCPNGMRILGHFSVRAYSTGGGGEWTIRCPDQTGGTNPNLCSSAANVAADASFVVLTATNGNITGTYNAGPGVAHISMATLGYWDRRGMDGYYYG